jgi:hypothetical protein
MANKQFYPNIAMLFARRSVKEYADLIYRVVAKENVGEEKKALVKELLSCQENPFSLQSARLDPPSLWPGLSNLLLLPQLCRTQHIRLSPIPARWRPSLAATTARLSTFLAFTATPLMASR